MKLKIFWRMLSMALAVSMYISCPAQLAENKIYSKEISIINDNDFYLLQKKDGYYTNGTIIKFSVASAKHNSNIIKKINHLEAGQLLFNPGKRRKLDLAVIDRPITGYLYAKFIQSSFYNKSFMQWGASVGTIGKAALGKTTQTLFHEVISVNSDDWEWIWDYQLKNEAGLNVHGSYALPLLSKPSFIQVTPQVKAIIGSTFTNVTTGALLQIGKFNITRESSYWNARLQANSPPLNPQKELFVFYHPEVMYQVYNATVQGGLFLKNKGPYTSAIERFVTMHQVGIMYSTKILSVSVQGVYQSKEAQTQKRNHAFGRVQFAYRFQRLFQANN